MTQVGHDIEYKTIKMINKFYHYHQINGKAHRQLKFILKKNIDFHYKIIVDIIYLNRKPVLYAIDAATAFQSG